MHAKDDPTSWGLRDVALLQAVELFSRVSDMAAAALGKQCAETLGLLRSVFFWC